MQSHFTEFTTEFERILVYFYRNAIFFDVRFVVFVLAYNGVSLVVIPSCSKLAVHEKCTFEMKCGAALCSLCAQNDVAISPFSCGRVGAHRHTKDCTHKHLRRHRQIKMPSTICIDFILFLISSNAISYNCTRRHALASSPVTLKCTQSYLSLLFIC